MIIKRIVFVLLLCILILFFFKDLFWLKYTINILIIFIGFPYGKIDSYFLKKLLWMTVPILLGIVGFYKLSFVDVIRDIYYYLIPVIFTTIGYIYSRLFSLKDIISSFIFFGFIFSLVYIMMVLQKFGFDIVNNFLLIRDEINPGNSLTIISLFILIFKGKFGLIEQYSNLTKLVLIIINIIAFILFGSRTYLIALLIFLFFILFNKISFRKTLVITSLIVFGVLLFISFNSFEQRKDGEAITFTSKLISSFVEVGNDEFLTERDITTKYRAYEAIMAFKTFNNGSIFEHIFGRGFGALVDLELYVQLGEGEFRFIPVLHNGFLYLLVKTGIMGLFCYFMLFYYIYIDTGNISNTFLGDNKLLFLNRLVKSSIILLFVSNFVVSSFVNVEFEFLYIFLFSIYFKMVEYRNNDWITHN